MANWSLPTLSDLYANFRQYLSDRLDDSAKMFNSSTVTATNIPTGTIRWNSTSSKFEIWSGTAWGNLTTTYGISISGSSGSCTGNAASSSSCTGNAASASTAAAVTEATVVKFNSGTRLLFQQTTAPTGWTKETAAGFNDIALRITTGTVGTGGVTNFSGISTSTVAGTILTTLHMPSHNHVLADPGHAHAVGYYQATGGGFPAASAVAANFYAGNTESATTGITMALNGGDNAHNHGLGLNLKYADVIIAYKN